MRKNILKIAVAVMTSVIMAFWVAFVIVDITKKEIDNDNNYSSGVVEVDAEVSSVPEQIEEAPPVEIGLVITSPKSVRTNTTTPEITFTGTSDPAAEVMLNGQRVERNENGGFSFVASLKIGNNTFNFEHKGKVYTYTVNYRYVVMNYYNPSKASKFDGGSVMPVTVTARRGSKVTATFCGATLELTPQTVDSGEEFINYGGGFQLEEGGLYDVSLGAVTFTATYNGITESFKSGNITCKKSSSILDSDPNATPTGGRYIDVGSGRIAEIIAYEAESFNAYSTDDQSRPTNSYLPKGTVDYSSSQRMKYVCKKETKEYAVLRYGRQVYVSRKNIPTNEIVPIIKEYAGILPDHNEINITSFNNGTRHTTLTLDVLWKAPFYFELLNQGFVNPSKADYNFSTATYSYVDITLCYATVLTGELAIPADNPIFSSAEIIKNASDYTLRLHLKKKGEFYGWDANYNSAGQLVFEFLNPAKITAADNEYGANLSGVKILIDVGHGGKDPGALGSLASYTEAVANLNLANKLKAELESMGATVLMTRTGNTTSSNDDKIKMLKAQKPDYCIAIHHNSSGVNKNKNGFSAHFSQYFSKKAAEYVYNNTVYSALYRSTALNWHYYYTARSSYCPVVLTENGYMSNVDDYSKIMDDSYNSGKAKAMAKGIAQYFLSIQ